ncbi:hypothetical protein HPB49_020149 [Dermacentor silvarum]|uniref:Uncharacterized protein n=1 Tax=Dermacentor silvarum TaxID=543639 RepID=A0ACB8D824_DERSI|nr:hypothetical protein HPB49_020149 [Dermacentor silvarum]
MDYARVARDVVVAGLSKVQPYLIRNLLEAGSTALVRTMQASQKLEPWALRLFDSSGKYPTGYFEAAHVDPGSFDECFESAVRDRYGKELSRGQYCNLLVYTKNARSVEVTNAISVAFHLRFHYLSEYVFTPEDPIARLGVCFTDDCNQNDLHVLANSGQCSCPSGFQPWDEHNCTAIQTEDPSSSWMSPLLPLSGFGLIILLVVCVCASTQWSYGSRWAKSYIGDKESAPTLIVWSQASIGDQTPSVPLALQPASPNTDSLAQQQMDSELFNEGLCSQHDSWLAAVAERSSELTNQLNSLTELRGLCSVPEESFVRPELSGDEMYSKYPHLRLILSTTSSSSAHVPAQRRPTPLTPVHTETTPSASRQTSEARFRLCDSTTDLENTLFIVRKTLQSPTSRKRAARSESPSKRVAFPDELAASSVLQPESESEQLGQRSAALQAFRRSSSTPWSTFGSSLDSLLSAPVVARIVTSSSCTDDAVSHTTTSAKSNDHQPTLSTSVRTSGERTRLD